MIINYFLGHVLLLLIPLGLTIFCFWLFFHKWKWSEKIFGVALIPGAILWLLLWMHATLDLIVIKKDRSVDHSMVFGGVTYTAEDGQVVEVRRVILGISNRCDVYIINTSDAYMAMESIGYGSSPIFLFSAGPAIIPPHRSMMETSVPDYFPNENPPGSVNVTNGVKSDSRDWLRTATDEEVMENRGSDFNLVPIE